MALSGPDGVGKSAGVDAGELSAPAPAAGVPEADEPPAAPADLSKGKAKFASMRQTAAFMQAAIEADMREREAKAAGSAGGAVNAAEPAGGDEKVGNRLEKKKARIEAREDRLETKSKARNAAVEAKVEELEAKLDARLDALIPEVEEVEKSGKSGSTSKKEQAKAERKLTVKAGKELLPPLIHEVAVEIRDAIKDSREERRADRIATRKDEVEAKIREKKG